MNIVDILTTELFSVCVTLESSHEHEDLQFARKKLQEWGFTYEQAVIEVMRRARDAREIRENEAALKD